ncbi:MAG: ABC transporter ATP-binding protein [Betaproteobacteria bacterium]|nr:ABC transporter ATP-binding protein [Betaproteobacteria bacterium]
MLSIRGLSKSFGGARPREVLRDISLDVQRGEYLAIMGESGVGKSTLLNLIAGLDLPDSGTIVFNGAELTALGDTARTVLRRNRMGFVFQAFHLLPHLTVAQNVALPLFLNSADTAQASERVAAMLAAIRLAGAADAYPRELAGGEMQRVAIARALVHRPLLLLADEPTGNLDPETAAQVLALLREQVKGESGAGILVTHSALAAATADRVLTLTADGLRPAKKEKL